MPRPVLRQHLAGAGFELDERFHDAHQAIAPQDFQFADGAIAGLLLGAFHHAVDQLVFEFRGLQFGPGQF